MSVLCFISVHIPKYPGYKTKKNNKKKKECFSPHNSHRKGNFIFIILDFIGIHLQTQLAQNQIWKNFINLLVHNFFYLTFFFSSLLANTVIMFHLDSCYQLLHKEVWHGVKLKSITTSTFCVTFTTYWSSSFKFPCTSDTLR